MLKFKVKYEIFKSSLDNKATLSKSNYILKQSLKFQ